MIVNKKDNHPTTSTTSTLDSSINSSLTDKSPQQIVRPLAITTLIKDEKSESLKQNNFLCSGMIEQRNKDTRVEEVNRKQLYNSCIRPNNLFIPNYSPLPTRPKSELSRRPSISLTDSTVLQGEAGCGSNSGRFTIKYDNTEYVVDVGGSQTNINKSQDGNAKNNNLNINYRLYRRSNSVATNKFNINNKPKMSVVGRMASIFVNDDIINNKQTETISQKQKRPTSWGFSERSCDTDNSIAGSEEDTYNNYHNFDCNDEKPNEKEQQQQKRFGEMALETVKR
uniref:Uncharacterized protein n=1 Tax=Meloidogyne enterolobii TaxID=390850 RepID=A0A6V7TPS1_MELEN|nr:unnamed protein product [Meloidogyne enterolobii]